MMNSINSTGMPIFTSGIFWLHIHWFFGLFVLIGLIFLIIWTVKVLTTDKLKTLSIWFLTIGIIGALLTALPAMYGLRQMIGTWSGSTMMMKNPMMMQMMKSMHDKYKDGGGEDHDEMFKIMRKMMDEESDGIKQKDTMGN